MTAPSVVYMQANVMAEYRVYAGVVTIEVDTVTGLQVLELNTSEARELQLALAALLGPALGDAPAAPVHRDRMQDRFEREVDPMGELDPEERAVRTAHARKAYHARLQLRSVQARQKNKRNALVPDGSANPRPAAPVPDRLAYGPKEAAQLLGLSRAHIYNLIASGELQSTIIGQRSRRILRSELERFVAGSSDTMTGLLGMPPAPAAIHEDPTERSRRIKKLQRDVRLRMAVKARDRGRCRYCSVEVNWAARTGSFAGGYDLVDPTGALVIDNVVVACRDCNARKAGRSLELSGMTLVVAPQAGDE